MTFDNDSAYGGLVESAAQMAVLRVKAVPRWLRWAMPATAPMGRYQAAQHLLSELLSTERR